MRKMKPAGRLLVALTAAAVFGGVSAVAFEIALEFDRWDLIVRDYTQGLWVSDIALVVGTATAFFCGYWGWKEAEGFRDLIVIDLVKWVRGYFNPR